MVNNDKTLLEHHGVTNPVIHIVPEPVDIYMGVAMVADGKLNGNCL